MNLNNYESRDHKITRISYYSQCAFTYLGSILLSESFLAKYLMTMGFSDALTGIISSLATFSNIFMLLSLVLINHTKNIKRAVTICICTNMTLFLLLYLLPFLNISHTMLVIIVFVCVGVGNAVNCLGNPLLSRWIMFFDYSGRLAHALKRVQRMGIAVRQDQSAVQPMPSGVG